MKFPRWLFVNNLLVELSNVLKVQSEKGEKMCENYAGIRIIYYVLLGSNWIILFLSI